MGKISNEMKTFLQKITPSETSGTTMTNKLKGAMSGLTVKIQKGGRKIRSTFLKAQESLATPPRKNPNQIRKMGVTMKKQSAGLRPPAAETERQRAATQRDKVINELKNILTPASTADTASRFKKTSSDTGPMAALDEQPPSYESVVPEEERPPPLPPDRDEVQEQLPPPPQSRRMGSGRPLPQLPTSAATAPKSGPKRAEPQMKEDIGPPPEGEGTPAPSALVGEPDTSTVTRPTEQKPILPDIKALDEPDVPVPRRESPTQPSDIVTPLKPGYADASSSLQGKSSDTEPPMSALDEPDAPVPKRKFPTQPDDIKPLEDVTPTKRPIPQPSEEQLAQAKETKEANRPLPAPPPTGAPKPPPAAGPPPPPAGGPPPPPTSKPISTTAGRKKVTEEPKKTTCHKTFSR